MLAQSSRALSIHTGHRAESIPGTKKRPIIPKQGRKAVNHGGVLSAVPPWLIGVPQCGAGGAEGTRTPYLNTASVALSRMSYSPRQNRQSTQSPLSGTTRQPVLLHSRPRLTGEFDARCRLALPGGSLRGASTTPGQRLVCCARGTRGSPERIPFLGGSVKASCAQ